MAQNGGTGRDMRVVIIGGGMSGILSAIKLREAGYGDVTIYEKGESFGGTWRENSYPGLACDVPAHVYSYSFEPNPAYSSTFAPGPEIRAYFERVAEQYGVGEITRFGTKITECVFKDGRWHLKTDKGESDTADVLIAATGVLHHPRFPNIEGIETFEGACFHSSQWDHSVPLNGKRVGIVGTGSTAIQITSAIVDTVSEFKLFQRTAQWVMPIDNEPYSEEFKAELARNPEKVQEVRDSWNALFDEFSKAVIDADSPQMKDIEAACLANLEDNVRDPVLKEKLRPDYRAGCKRLIFSPDFYDAIQHPNADVVTEGIDRVEAKGIRTKDGTLHELDVLVLATGYKPDAFIRPTTVLGRGGVDLDEVWKDKPIAYHAISVPDFPNFFMLNGPNAPVGNFSLIRIAELQLAYIMKLMDKIRHGNCREISATQTAMVEFEKARAEATKKTIWTTGCKSWYLDKEGVPGSWPWSQERFRQEMETPVIEAYEQVS